MGNYFVLNEQKEMRSSFISILVYLLLYVMLPLKVWTISKMGPASQLTTTPRSLSFAGIPMRTSIRTVTTLLMVRILDFENILPAYIQQ